MPNDTEAEAAVLGSMLLSDRAPDLAFRRLTVESFYSLRHAEVFSAMQAVHRPGAAIDVVLLKHTLSDRQELEKLGGAGYLADLAEGVLNPANVECYIELVRETGERRRAIVEGQALTAGEGLALSPAAELLLADCTDTGNGGIIASLYGDRLRYDHRQDAWLVWRQHWWETDPDGEHVRLAVQAAQWRYHRAAQLSDAAVAKRVAQWAITSKGASRITAALTLATSMPPIADRGEGWDADPWLFSLANGVIDLRKGELRAGCREDRITKHSPVSFDSRAACPRWEQFLDEVFGGGAELIGFIRRAVGYSLTGDTSEQCFFVLHGRGANGKSALLAVLRHIFGPYAFDPGFSAFEEARGYPPHPEQVAELAGRRFITASETRENSHLNEQRLKALSHGDTTSAAFKYGRRFEVKPQGKIWLALNHKPRVSDDSLGFWRSVRLIPFERQFLGQDADTDLANKLIAEAPGILAWAVRGCIEWQTEGLGLSEAVLKATEGYQLESDPLGDFLAARCTIGPAFTCQAGQLYREYGDWAKAEGIRDRDTLSCQAFGRRLGERFAKGREGAGRQLHYYGIGVRRAEA
jgi:putative DNA primase/helicase